MSLQGAGSYGAGTRRRREGHSCGRRQQCRADQAAGRTRDRLHAGQPASLMELLFTTPGGSAIVNGVILHEETIRQHRARASPSPTCSPGTASSRASGSIAAQVSGPGRRATTRRQDSMISVIGSGNTRRSGHGSRSGAARFPSSDRRPSPACLRDSAQAFARFAAICQQRNLVPIVAPEVDDGRRSHHRALRGSHRRRPAGHLPCAANTRSPSRGARSDVDMVVPGTMCNRRSTPEEVAAATIRCLRRHVRPRSRESRSSRATRIRSKPRSTSTPSRRSPGRSPGR